MAKSIASTLPVLLLMVALSACTSAQSQESRSIQPAVVEPAPSSSSPEIAQSAATTEPGRWQGPQSRPYGFAEGVTLELPDHIELDVGEPYQIMPDCSGVDNPIYVYSCIGGSHPVLSVSEDGLVTGESLGFDYVTVDVYAQEGGHVVAYGHIMFTVGDSIVGAKDE